MRALVLCVAALLIAAGCAPRRGAPMPGPGEKLRVVATTGMIADTVRNVGGDLVEVHGLMGAGVDPHLFKPTEGDVRRVAEAHVVFYNGLHLEARLAEVLERMGDRVRTVPVGEAVPEGRRVEPEDAGGQHDPHIWFDVSLWMLVTERVRDTLMEMDPANAPRIREQAGAYLGELAALHEEARTRLAAIPAEQRVLVTAHDAFAYFGRAYGFEVRGLQGISTAAEAGARDVAQLADFIAERRLPAIFVETSVPRRNVEAVMEATRARGHAVAIGGELFSDSMGSTGTPGGTYTGMVRHNIDTIVEALSGGAKP